MNWAFFFYIILLALVKDSCETKYSIEELQGIFTLVKNKQVANDSFIANVVKSSSIHKAMCLSLCLQLDNCFVVFWSTVSSICMLYKLPALFNLIESTDDSFSLYLRKNNLLEGLVAYWAFNQDMQDYTSFKDMKSCGNYSLVDDRFGNPSSAIYFNSSFCQVQSGRYFNSQYFTISAWVNVVKYTPWARILDFGNGQEQDNVVLTISNDNDLYPAVAYFNNTALNLYSNTFSTVSVTSQSKLNYNMWQYVAGVLNSTHISIYVDGVLTNSMLINTRPNNVFRIKCYIGRSNYVNDNPSNVIIDDLKIYNRALNQIEIQRDMYFKSLF